LVPPRTRLSDDAPVRVALLASSHQVSTSDHQPVEEPTEQEPAMAASIVIEEERGTVTRRLHPHNGYYAGDFRAARPQTPSLRDYALRAVITAAVR
jgi:hypothetical protein